MVDEDDSGEEPTLFERALRNTQLVLDVSKEIAFLIQPLAAKYVAASNGTIALGMMITAYSLVKFAYGNDAERRYWEAARIAKELYEKLGSKAKA